MAYAPALVLTLACACACLPAQEQNAADRLAWTFEVGSSVLSNPLIATTTRRTTSIFFGSYNGFVYGINAANRKSLWKPVFTNDMVRSSASILKNKNRLSVFITGGDSELYAINALTGSKFWVFNSGAKIGEYQSSTPAVLILSNITLVFYGSVDNNIYAINAATGKAVWNYSTGTPVHSSPQVHNNGTHDLVVIGSDSGYIYALNALTGDLFWRFLTGGNVRAAAAFWTNATCTSVFIGSNDGSLYAINAATGDGLFRVRTGNSITSTPVIGTGNSSISGPATIYFSSYDWNVYAVDPRTGVKLWTFMATTFVIADPTVLFQNNSLAVYVGDGNGLFFGIDGHTGKQLWQYRMGGPVWSTAAVLPASPGALLVFGCQCGYVAALKTVM